MVTRESHHAYFVYYRLIDSLKTCASIAHHVVGNAIEEDEDSDRGLAAVLHILIHAGLFVFGAVCLVGDVLGLVGSGVFRVLDVCLQVEHGCLLCTPKIAFCGLSIGINDGICPTFGGQYR